MTLDEMVDAVDSAFERRDLDAVAALLDGFDLTTADDDTAVGLLVATLIGRVPLRAERIAYAERLRACLLDRGWTCDDVDAAFDGMLIPKPKVTR